MRRINDFIAVFNQRVKQHLSRRRVKVALVVGVYGNRTICNELTDSAEGIYIANTI